MIKTIAFTLVVLVMIAAGLAIVPALTEQKADCSMQAEKAEKGTI